MNDHGVVLGLSNGGPIVLLGLVSDVAGALLLSYAYFAITRPRDLPRAFLSALVRGGFSRGIAAVDVPKREADASLDTARRNERNRLRALQGVAFLALGFLLQAVGLVIR